MFSLVRATARFGCSLTLFRFFELLFYFFFCCCLLCCFGWESDRNNNRESRPSTALVEDACPKFFWCPGYVPSSSGSITKRTLVFCRNCSMYTYRAATTKSFIAWEQRYFAFFEGQSHHIHRADLTRLRMYPVSTTVWGISESTEERTVTCKNKIPRGVPSRFWWRSCRHQTISFLTAFVRRPSSSSSGNLTTSTYFRDTRGREHLLLPILLLLNKARADTYRVGTLFTMRQATDTEEHKNQTRQGYIRPINSSTRADDMYRSIPPV